MARILIGNIKGPQGPQGIQGPQGKQGIQGPQGPLPPLTNNALATVPGVSALDAVMGKILDDKINKANSDFTGAKNDIAGKQSKAWTLLGAAWGNGHSTLPSSATEVFCEVRVADKILQTVTFNYPIMEGDTRMYHNGSTEYQAAVVAAGRTVYMQYAKNTEDVTSSSTIYIYYR